MKIWNETERKIQILVRTIVLGLWCMAAPGVLLAGSAVKPEGDKPEGDGAKIEAPGAEDIAETIAPEEDELLGGVLLGASTVGTSIATAGRAACWASYDSYRDRSRLAVGEAYTRYTSGGRYAVADAYFDGADCGMDAHAGTVDYGDTLDLFLTNAYMIDEVTDDGGKVYFRLRLDYYCPDGCEGTCTNATDVSDLATCLSTSSGQTWREALDIEGDYDDCHRPDLVITTSSAWYPDSRDTVGYYYHVEAWTCDSDGTNCSYQIDTGCFDVEFQ